MEFTQTQKNILYELINGSTNAQIAENVGYSESSVKRRIKELFTIFSVNNRAALIRESAIAKARGLL